MIGLSDQNVKDLIPLQASYTISGKEVSFEAGKLALMSNGSVTMSDQDGNILLVTAGFKEEGLNEKADFFPLVVDYQERYYATGKIGGNRFMKREGRPTDAATLTSRLIDRPIRPMFPKGIINDTQILATVLSSDNSKELGSWGITGASLSLLMAGAPFEGPVSGVKIALMNDGSYIYDPSFEDEKVAKLTLLIAGTLDAITMVEAGANEISEQEMLDALVYAHKIIIELCNAQNDFISKYEKQFGIATPKVSFNLPDTTLYDKVHDFLTEEKLECLYNKWKKEFQKELNMLDVEVTEFLTSTSDIEKDGDSSFVGAMVYKRVKEIMRKNILQNERRLDGRKLDEVRHVAAETWLLPRTHGSGLFRRGVTQVLSIATLGGPEDEQLIDGMHKETTKRYIHHYNFPPYSVGEVRMMRGVGRREIGHGRLAERALEAVLPSEEDFPYVVRVVSEVTTCNGSSSMGSVCGSTLALMNAGVPIKSPVSGVAMGMIYDEESGNYKIMSDIQAQEDFLWDMDFKVARSKNGITAMQMDVKIKGLKMQVFEEAFAQAKASCEYISDAMLEAQPEVAKKLSPHAPLIMSMQVPEDKIRVIIGKGGETIQKLQADHNVTISIADDGMTTITAENQAGGEAAVAQIQEILWVPEVGFMGMGKVVKIIEWVGAIVEFKGGNSGMIHISKLSKERVTNVEDVVKAGDMVDFEIIQVDMMKGRIGLKKMDK